MKFLIKRASLCMALTMLVTLLCACGGEKYVKSSEKSLYMKGLEVIEQMAEMADSEMYLQAHTSSAEILELVSGVSEGDFTEPKSVFAVTATSDFLTDYEELDADSLSENLRKVLSSKLLAAQAAQVNGHGSAACVAAASVCSAGKCFVDNRVDEDVVYIYTFENAVPAAVSFTVGENGAVSASGTFMIYNGFRSNTVEEVSEHFGPGVEIEIIKEAA